MQPPKRFALVAGEKSGDALGAGLIEAIKRRVPDAEFFGIAGEQMAAAGCSPWYRAEELSVMGLAEVLHHLPRLLRLRRDLIRRLEASRPDVLIGIDSPDFNVPVELRLRAAGFRTVQYVSPQIWAWRQSRVRTVRAAADLVLCVLPFETDFYAAHGVNARFVGHPLADAIPPHVDRNEARERLGLATDAPLVAVLPGSRRPEVTRLAAPFLATAEWVQRARPGIRFAIALANAEMEEVFARSAGEAALDPAPVRTVGKAREVMAAADAVLTASGTASLEALLLKRPMVVAYRVSPLTYAIARRLGVARIPHFSLPNLLAGRGIVAEFAQDRVRPDAMGPALLRCLDGETETEDWYHAFDSIHRRLRRGASDAAAEAVLELLDRGQGKEEAGTHDARSARREQS
ncbi:MAG TPA: lipid-A-disaccharide synthase [Gammaproteobacteria bacterium]